MITIWDFLIRPNERKYEHSSYIAKIIIKMIIDFGCLKDIKSLACTNRLLNHLVKKTRWEIDYYAIYWEKTDMVKKNKITHKKTRMNDLLIKRYKAYDELFKLLFKLKNDSCVFIKKDKIVGPWTVIDTVFNYNTYCGRVRHKWKDYGKLEFLLFYQYYKDKTGLYIHYKRYGSNIIFKLRK